MMVDKTERRMAVSLANYLVGLMVGLMVDKMVDCWGKRTAVQKDYLKVE